LKLSQTQINVKTKDFKVFNFYKSKIKET
jgi:hypothetical protein